MFLLLQFSHLISIFVKDSIQTCLNNKKTIIIIILFCALMLRTIKQSFNYQLFPLGVAQCLMCLWTHFGQKKTFDCSLRRDVGRFRLGCSLHLSYRHGTSPRLSRSFQKQPLTSHRNGMTPSYSGLKNFPKLDKSKLSSSLSSLRCLGDTGLASGFPGSQMTSTRTQGNGVTRSSNVLHNTQSGGSWL